MHPLRAVVRAVLVSLLVVSVVPLALPSGAAAQAQSARARERRRRAREARRAAAARREGELEEAREQCVLPTPDAPWEAGAVIVPGDGALDAPPRVTTRDAVVDPAALAEVEDDAPRWALDIEALTQFPITIGGALTLRTPALVFIRAHGAVVPEPYVALVDDVLRGAGVYDEQISADVRSLATSTVLASISLGLALDAIDLAAGYSLLYRQATLDRAFIVRSIGPEGPLLAPAIPDEVPAEALVHMVHGELAARFVIAEHFLLRIGMRWDHAVGAHVDAHLDASADPELDAAVILAEERVREELEARTFFPSVLVSLGATL